MVTKREVALAVKIAFLTGSVKVHGSVTFPGPTDVQTVGKMLVASIPEARLTVQVAPATGTAAASDERSREFAALVEAELRRH